MKTGLQQAGVVYVDTRALEDLAVERRAHVLGVLAYGEETRSRIPAAMPIAWTGLRTLDQQPRFEVWLSANDVASEQQPAMRFTHDGEIAFGCIEFEADRDFQAHALEHYLRLFAQLDARGYPHLLRIWHYLPQIHSEAEGLERYRAFSIARYEAFMRNGRNIARDAPAASAVGKRAGAVVIAFLAARRPGTPIENPRQVSAYHYPPQYGPRGPTFARALYAGWGGQDQLYISGTASIVGHESRHRDDPERQADETLENLRTLVSEACTKGLACACAWQRLLFKVYLRTGVAQEMVIDRLRRTFGEDANVLVLEADICRRELLLEIEAVALCERSDAA